MDIVFGAYYTTLTDQGHRTDDVYKCVGIAKDFLQSDEDMVLFAKVGKNGTSSGLLYTTVDEFLYNFEIL